MFIGSSYGPRVRKWGAAHELANLGQCFIAINPNMFADGFDTRMSDLMDSIRQMTPVSPHVSIEFNKHNLLVT